jgi:hypothetical protein
MAPRDTAPRAEAEKHAPLAKPFVLVGLAALVAGSTLGMLYVLRIHLSLGVVSPVELRAHAQAQVFGFLVPFVTGFATYLVPRVAAGKPLRRRRVAVAGLAGLAMGAAANLLATLLPDGAALDLRRGGALAVAAGAILAAFALHGPILEMRRSREGSGRGFERLLELSLSFLALSGLADAAAFWLATPATENAPPAGIAAATWRLALEGFAGSMALAISARMFPGFLGIDPRRAYPGAASVRPATAGAAHGFWLSVAAWGGSVALGSAGNLLGDVRVERAADILFAAGAIPFALRLGLAPTRGGPAIDTSQDPLFRYGARLAYGALLLAALVGAVAAIASLAGFEVHTLWLDARRHLFTLGFLLTLVATMAGRLSPGVFGRRIAFPWFRSFALFAFPAAALLRALEAFAGQWGPAELLWASALSGPLALSAVLALATSVATGALVPKKAATPSL